MIFEDCSELDIEQDFKDKYVDKYREECRVCGIEEDLSFHFMEETKSINLAMLLCDDCHDLFCEDLKTDTIATSEQKLVNMIQKYAKVSDTIYINKIHGNNFQENGLPDFIGHVKGRYIGVETKKYKNNPSMIQKYQIKQIQKTGGLAYACYSIEQFYTIVNSIREDKDSE